MLPSDLVKLIYDYLPLKQIQNLYNSGYKLYLTNINNIDYSGDRILSPFELYCNNAMLQGKIGYDGQFYLPPYVALLYASRIGDMDLVNYYLIRYFNGNDSWEQDTYWPLDAVSPSFIRILLTISKDNIRANLIDYFNKYYFIDIANYYGSGLKFAIHDNLSALWYVEADWLGSDISDSTYQQAIGAVLTRVGVNYGCITPQFIAKVQAMLYKLNNVYLVNKLEYNIIAYIDLLKILMGQVVDLNRYNNNNHYLAILLTAAFCVYNEGTKATVFNTINNNQFLVNTLGSRYTFIPTLVMYDYNPDTIINKFNTVNTINLYLNNLAYGRIENIPLINYYLAIKNGLYQNDDRFKIHDPETTLRLIRYFSSQQLLPYLAPSTDFDKQILIDNNIIN